jgi:GDP-L-fucose synthase
MSMSFWKGKRVMVTGGAGFLGQPLVARLKAAGAEVDVPRKSRVNFTDFAATLRYMEDLKAQIVIHCAAYYGGIWINQLYPGRIFYENLVMGAHVMEASRVTGVEKFVGIGTACSYPGYIEGDLKEPDLWNGLPHETVINYGMTKKMMAVQGWAYRKQYNFPSIHLILTNLYGPGDCYNPTRSHVAAALIRKFTEARMAGAPEVEVWGTGRPIREFMYVGDCAEAILMATEKYDDTAPLNLGTGIGTSIRRLTELIHECSGFQGSLRWNSEKPDGQAYKVLDVTAMKKNLHWEPPTMLEDGLKTTAEWYRANKDAADAKE